MSDTVKRDKIIKIRVSAEEHETLKMLKTKAQLAEWMRDTCLNYGQGDLVTQMQGPTPADPKLLGQLSGIGNNMNQIARAVNTGSWGPSNVVDIVAHLKAIESELEKIREAHR